MWRQFFKFANSGAIGTLAHYGVLWILVNLAGIPPVMGSAFGAAVGAGVNYLLNYHWTFGSELPHAHTLPRFMAIAAFSLVLNTVVMAVLLSVLDIHYLLAQLIATVVCLIMNYAASRCWAFKDHSI